MTITTLIHWLLKCILQLKPSPLKKKKNGSCSNIKWNSLRLWTSFSGHQGCMSGPYAWQYEWQCRISWLTTFCLTRRCKPSFSCSQRERGGNADESSPPPSMITQLIWKHRNQRAYIFHWPSTCSRLQFILWNSVWQKEYSLEEYSPGNEMWEVTKE